MKIPLRDKQGTVYHHDRNGHIVVYQSLRSHDIIIWQSYGLAKKE